jgi:hypothetical membrane protein
MGEFNDFTKGTIFPWSGIIGTIVTSLGCFIATLGYKGSSGEPYSILNYFISELGAVHTSELAIAFNLGVLIGGLMLTVFMAGLFGYFTTKIGKFGSILGTISGICGALVGLYPMDGDIATHGLTAMGFFYGGMFTVIILTIALFLEKDPQYPLLLKILGIVCAVFFFIFNVVLGEFASIFSGSNTDIDLNNISLDSVRPQGIWWMALFEWLSLMGMLVWIFALSLFFTKINKNNKK